MTNGMRGTGHLPVDLGHFDVVVLGGGPAGSAAATLLARQDCRVLLLEKEHFPRYHIGESLIPGCLRALDILGVRQEVERAGFVKKRGVTFAWGGDEAWSISFDEQKADPNYAFHVERARFDEILLRHAQRSGVDVREGVTVRGVDVSRTDEVVINSDAGVARASYVVDATGQSSVLGRQVGDRHFDPGLRNVAMWQYFRGGARLPEPRTGHIAVVRHGDGWWWYIPLEAEEGGLTSVGLVMSADAYKRHGADPETIYEEARRASPRLAGLLTHATPTSKLHTTSDWSYRSQHVAGDRWLLAGDAAGFVDPLLSTGCYMALTAGYLAGLCLSSVLRDPSMKPAAFRYFDASYNRVVDEIHAMVRIFYKTIRPTQAFDGAQTILGGMESPRELFVKLAAGNVEDSTDCGVRNYFQDTGLPSEVFGAVGKVPDKYGVPFEPGRQRVLGPVEEADLPPGVAGPLMLVEENAQLRFVRPEEIVEPPVQMDMVSEAPPHTEVPTPEPGPVALRLEEVRTHDDAERLLRERVPVNVSRSALIAYRHEGVSTPVVVGFLQSAAVSNSWARVGGVALLYFTDIDVDPFENGDSRQLLDEVLRVARACEKSSAHCPLALQEEVAARLSHGGWQVALRAAHA